MYSAIIISQTAMLYYPLMRSNQGFRFSIAATDFAKEIIQKSFDISVENKPTIFPFLTKKAFRNHCLECETKWAPKITCVKNA